MSNHSATKRQKERARQEKARDKRIDREARRRAKADRPAGEQPPEEFALDEAPAAPPPAET